MNGVTLRPSAAPGAGAGRTIAPPPVPAVSLRTHSHGPGTVLRTPVARWPVTLEHGGMKPDRRLTTILAACLFPVAATDAAAPASSRPAETALATILRDARPGDVLKLPASIGPLADIPHMPLHRRAANDSPQLLFSDDPEYFRGGNGIALQEEVNPGRVRLYVYHVPATGTGPKTITAIIENRGPQPMRFRMLRSAFPKPGKDYHRIGKAGLTAWFDARPEAEVRARSLLPGERVPIDPIMDAASAADDELVHGLYEFEINQPARISVLQREPGEDSANVLDTLPKPPPVLAGHEAAGAGRGLFSSSNIDVTPAGFVLDPAKGPLQLVVADGQTDPWIRGRDGITGSQTRNQGNYGVMYRIRLRRVGSSAARGKGIAVFMAHGFVQSKWCGHVAAAVQINGRTVPLPTRKYSFEAFPTAALIATLPPLAGGATEDIEILYSPPGASCLPTPILFIPYE